MPLKAPARVSHEIFRVASRLRGRRSLHPDGIGFAATLYPAEEGAVRGIELFEAGERSCFVRLSRGAGLPGSVPDILGVAVRVPDAYGEGRHQDLLFATSGSAPIARHLLLPGFRGFFAHPYSTILPYRTPQGPAILGAFPEPGGVSPRGVEELRSAAPGRRFAIRIAGSRGGWAELATLMLGTTLPEDTTQGLRFNPANTGGGLEPAPLLAGIRTAAYVGSQRGWTAAGG